MGFKVRIRTINTQAANGGVECSGAFTEHEMCSTETQCGNNLALRISYIYILVINLNKLDLLFLHLYYRPIMCP